MTEDSIRNKFVNWLRREGVKKTYIEIPVFSRSIDVVSVDNASGKITAYEIKKDDMSALLKQANICLHYSEYVNLVIPEAKFFSGRTIKNNLGDFGVITYRESAAGVSFTQAVEPKPSPSYNEKLSVHLVDSLTRA
jgi:hypothetical protein